MECNGFHLNNNSNFTLVIVLYWEGVYHTTTPHRVNVLLSCNARAYPNYMCVYALYNISRGLKVILLFENTKWKTQLSGLFSVQSFTS